MVTMIVDDVRTSVNHHTREFTVAGGTTHRVAAGGEIEVTITCRVDLNDKTKVAALNELIGSSMKLDLYAPSAPARPRQGRTWPDIHPVPPTEFDLDITSLIRGNRRFTEPSPDAPTPSTITGSW